MATVCHSLHVIVHTLIVTSIFSSLSRLILLYCLSLWLPLLHLYEHFYESLQFLQECLPYFYGINRHFIKPSMWRGVNYCILWVLLIIQSLFICIMFIRNKIWWLSHFSGTLQQTRCIKCFLQAEVYFNSLSGSCLFFF